MEHRREHAPEPPNARGSDPAGWLVGGGEMGKLIRSMDWSGTPLGPIGSWPQSLRTTVGLCLASNFPISLAWGPQHTQLYNDGYWPICGGKHPTSMGQDFTECWASAWPAIGEAFARARAGQTSFLENQRMFLDRHGYLEETFFTFSFSPIRDESGGVGGLFHPVTETTARMLSERRTRALRDLAHRTAQAHGIEEGFTIAAQTLAESSLDLPFTLFYLLDGTQARWAAGSGITAATPASPLAVALQDEAAGWPFGRVARTNRVELVDQLDRWVDLPPCGPYPERPKTAVVYPLALPGSTRPVAILVLGRSARLPFDEPYRAFFDLVAAAATAAVASGRAREEERRRVEALAELDRAKTAFFSNVSHEFRTPLTLILGTHEELLAEPELPAPARARVEVAHRNSLRLLRLVNTLLDFARIEAGRMTARFQPLDLATLTRDLASSFRSACDKAALRFLVECDPLPGPVHVDRDMWEKIVLNLISNAFKFTLEGEIEVRLKAVGACCELSVRDTGAGIPASEVPRVFERFHRVEATRGRTLEGTGIGLSLVKELVELHGGAVRVQSVHGEGTTFTVTLPFGAAHLPPDRLVPASATGSSSPGARPYVEEALRWIPGEVAAGDEGDPLLAVDGVFRPATQGETSPLPDHAARVLLADDNADLREYLVRLLSRTYEVEAVADGQAALEAARRRAPALVISDVMMPRLDGFGLLQQLRSDPRLRTVPFILLSARAGEESKGEGLEAGADDYLVKPFSARELLARVRTHLELSRVRQEWALALENANAELEAFSYSVSHDLRAPLRGLDGFSRALLKDYSGQLDERGRDYLARIHNAALRMGRLIDELLKLSRLSRAPLSRQWVDLGAVARRSFEALRVAEPDREVELELDGPLLAWGDAALLEAAVTNLIENAWKFTSQRDVAHVQLESRWQAGERVFRVRDDGAGFDMRFADKLFGPFQRLHSRDEFPGTGIGLATVRRILHRHGGDICAEGEVGRGASFYFTVGQQPEERPYDGPAHHPAGRG